MIKIVFLGTSSASPTNHRGLPSIALIREGEILLFDCGEGTQMQLKKADLRISKITKIFISHLHGDHINGLVGLLQTMDLEGREKPLLIVSPKGLEELVAVARKLAKHKFEFPIIFQDARNGEVVREADYAVYSAVMDHRILSFGYALVEDPRPGRFDVEKAKILKIPEGPLYGKLQKGIEITLPDGRLIKPEMVLGPPRPGRKIAIIFDTRPNANAVELAKDADLLIHEATYDSSMQDKAIISKHTTAKEAAEVALQANVKRLVLVHISTRYINEKVILKEAQSIFAEVKVARDFDEIELPRKE